MRGSGFPVRHTVLPHPFCFLSRHMCLDPSQPSTSVTCWALRVFSEFLKCSAVLVENAMKLPVSRSSSPVLVAAGVLDWVSFSPGSASSSGHRRARGRGLTQKATSRPCARAEGVTFSVTARHDRGFPELRFAFGKSRCPGCLSGACIAVLCGSWG